MSVTFKPDNYGMYLWNASHFNLGMVTHGGLFIVPKNITHYPGSFSITISKPGLKVSQKCVWKAK